MADQVSVRGYRVFYDNQAAGWGTIGGSLVRAVDGEPGSWRAVFGSGPHEDDDAGQHPFVVDTSDAGRTWTAPAPFGPAVDGDRSRQSLSASQFGPTQAGSILVNGCHMQLQPDATDRYSDLNFRAYTLVLGRQPADATEFAWRNLPPGTFLGEQFMEHGLQLPSGRLVFAIWGCKARGENWRCGVLLSDDDGQSWRYRDVGYEPSLDIRDRPAGEGYPAGFNEQSLFRLPSGRLVSMIRGREKLGRVPESPSDTWYFRSVSDDEGHTWTTPVETNVAGTGAAGVGHVLPDGSMLHACRVPYSRDLLAPADKTLVDKILADKELSGLQLVRSFDEGVSWQTELLVQQDPEGTVFDNHYNAMNGQFLALRPDEGGGVLYMFGQFDVKRKTYRILALELDIITL